MAESDRQLSALPDGGLCTAQWIVALSGFLINYSSGDEKMSRHHDHQNRLRRNLSEQIENIFRNAERFRWSHLDVNKAMTAIYNAAEWKQLTGMSYEYLRGKIDLLRNMMERKTTPAYFIKGEYLTTSSDKYRKISPQTVHQKYSDCCAWVWKDDPSKVYSGHGETLHI